jgi:hypothetical protein
MARKKAAKKQTPSVIFLNFKGKTGRGKSEQHKYAIFSNAAYKKDPSSYLVHNSEFGWVLDKPLSNKNTFTFVNVPKKQIIISYRGTDWGNITDIWQNIGIVTGSSLFKQRESSNVKLYDKTVKRFPGYNITLTGHSAGGYQAMAVAGKRGARAVVFNAASSPNKTPTEAFQLMKADIKHYSTTNLKSGDIDFVSLANPASTETVPVKVPGDAHTIDNFVPENHHDMEDATVFGKGRTKGDKVYCKLCKQWVAKSYWSRHVKTKKHRSARA